MSLSAESFDYVAELVRRESAVELGGKEYLVESRLTPLARAAGLEGFRAVDRFVHLVRRAAWSPQDVVEALVTTETSWFRDRPTFDALTRDLLPALPGRGRALRVWSAGCSTGQEPYSIVMALLDAGADVNDQLSDGESALVVAPRDERALAGALARLLSDESLARALAAAASALASTRHAPETFLRSLTQFYRGVVADARSLKSSGH